MKLYLENLESSILILERSAKTYNSLLEKNILSNDDMETIKAGVIQNFEVAYEQCWKFMRRWLHENISPGITDGITRRELFRLAQKHELIGNVDEWMLYHELRNLTSHTYNHNNAQRAFECALRFLPASATLLRSLEQKND
jgi:nucleotidyltransferase substrate binding protein (TIGR01987 family)